MIASGGLSGGLSSSIAGGNFWDGFRQGIITAGLNHAMTHGLVNNKNIKNVRDRFRKDASGNYIIDPDGLPDFTQKGISNLEQNVEGLAVDRAALNPELKISFDLTEKKVAIADNEVSIRLNKSLIPTNAHYAVVLFHEYRHAWQYNRGWFGKWGSEHRYITAYNLAERDAYWYQNHIGGGSYYDGNYWFNYYKNLTNHIKAPYIK